MVSSPAGNTPEMIIRTPDQRLRVFISSTLVELAAERQAVQVAVSALHLHPVLFETGARPHPAQALYRAYLAQSHIFIGIYWQRYGWVAPDMTISGLEDEYRLAVELPKLIYIKRPAPDLEPALRDMLQRIKNDDTVSYKYFATAEELQSLVQDDLALLLTERFEQTRPRPDTGREILKQQVILPRALTPLIGREQEVQALQTLLAEPATRLVTLTGPGGVGKSRLALEVAGKVAQSTDLDIYWISLAAVREPESMIAAIAQVLDVRERAGRSLLQSLQDYIQARPMLWLLDNFEQVIPAGSLLSELLAAAPGLQALVTSRAPLRIRGEQEFPVPPLPLPEDDGPAVAQALLENEAVRLFVARAQAAMPGFSLTASNAADVRAIVNQLEGLPLAIELTAARIKLLPPQAILARLHSRLQWLTGGAQDLPPRQQTLRNTLDWSHSLLGREVQTLFARLGIFTGGFTLEAAEAVCSAGGGDVFSGIESLLNNSLVRREADVWEQPRFSMLETVREYALEQLAAAHELEALRQTHAAFYLQVATQTVSAPFSGESERWLDSLEADYSNLRTAVQWFLDREQEAQQGWQMLVHLLWLWYRRGHLNEARQWFERAINQAASLGTDLWRANVLVYAGSIAMWQGDNAKAAPLMDEGLAIFRQHGNDAEVAMALFLRGVVAVHQGEVHRARAVLEEAMSAFRELDQSWFQAIILLHLGNVDLIEGDVPAVQAQMAESLALGRRVGDRWLIASAVNNFGEIERYQGNYESAESYYLESKALFEEVGSSPDVARALHSLGYVALSRGEHGRARELFAEGLALHQKLGVRRGIVECLAGLAAVLNVREEVAPAVQLLAAVQAHFQAFAATIWPADRLAYEHILTAAQAKLGEAAYAEATAQGEAMTLSEAQALAGRLLNL